MSSSRARSARRPPDCRPSRSTDCRSVRADVHAGRTPNTASATTATPAPTRIITGSAAALSSRGTSTGEYRASSCKPHRANAMPVIVAIVAITSDSVSSCRTSRRRSAPIADRTASSRSRSVARAMSSPATFAQATRSRNATAPTSTCSGRRSGLAISSRSARMTGRGLVVVSGMFKPQRGLHARELHGRVCHRPAWMQERDRLQVLTRSA